jgi:ArsR family transcriptional regulator
MSFGQFGPEGGSVPMRSAEPEEAGLARSIADHAAAASALLKAVSHEGRLMILCHLAAGPRSVTELEALLGARQAAVSQQLARLRLEGLVATRREGKAIFYSIHDPKVLELVRLLQTMFAR